MAIFIFDFGTILPELAVLPPVNELVLPLLVVPPLDELLQAATPRAAIASSGTGISSRGVCLPFSSVDAFSSAYLSPSCPFLPIPVSFRRHGNVREKTFLPGGTFL